MQILVVMGLLVRIIHLVPALAGLAATLALIPLSTLVGRAMAAVRKELVGYTDARVKLCTEVITGKGYPRAMALQGPCLYAQLLSNCTARGACSARAAKLEA